MMGTLFSDARSNEVPVSGSTQPPARAWFRRQTLLSKITILTATLVIAALGLCGLVGCSGDPKNGPSSDQDTHGSRSIASLSPGMTELIVELGLGDRLVGISDYCTVSKERESLPRLGTSLTPNYETIVTSSPAFLFTEAARGAPLEELQGLGPQVEALPWRSTQDLLAGIRRIGVVTGTKKAADALADRIESVLNRRPGSAAPSVLLALEHPAGQLSEVWYVADDTLHGDALRSAGARNAVVGMEGGVPKISLEKVIELDPDAILILSTQDELSPGQHQALLDDWRKLSTLEAVRSDRLYIVTGDRLFVTGPRILDVVVRIEEGLLSLFGSDDGNGAD